MRTFMVLLALALGCLAIAGAAGDHSLPTVPQHMPIGCTRPFTRPWVRRKYRKRLLFRCMGCQALTAKSCPGHRDYNVPRAMKHRLPAANIVPQVVY